MTVNPQEGKMEILEITKEVEEPVVVHGKHYPQATILPFAIRIRDAGNHRLFEGISLHFNRRTLVEFKTSITEAIDSVLREADEGREKP